MLLAYLKSLLKIIQVFSYPPYIFYMILNLGSLYDILKFIHRTQVWVYVCTHECVYLISLSLIFGCLRHTNFLKLWYFFMDPRLLYLFPYSSFPMEQWNISRHTVCQFFDCPWSQSCPTGCWYNMNLNWNVDGCTHLLDHVRFQFKIYHRNFVGLRLSCPASAL